MPNVVPSHQNPLIFAKILSLIFVFFYRIPKPLFYHVLAAQEHQKPTILNSLGLFGRSFRFRGVPKVVRFLRGWRFFGLTVLKSSSGTPPRRRFVVFRLDYIRFLSPLFLHLPRESCFEHSFLQMFVSVFERLISIYISCSPHQPSSQTQTYKSSPLSEPSQGWYMGRRTPEGITISLVFSELVS